MIFHGHKWEYFDNEGRFVNTEEEALFRKCPCGVIHHKLQTRNQEEIDGLCWVEEEEFLRERAKGNLYGQLKSFEEVMSFRKWQEELMKEDI